MTYLIIRLATLGNVAMTVPVIESFTEESLISGVNGLQPGDEILEIDGEKSKKWRKDKGAANFLSRLSK